MSSHAYVIFPDLKEKTTVRSAQARLQEAVGLTHAIDLSVKGSEVITLREIRPATYLGSGAVDRLKPLLKEREVDVVIMDCALSPIQQRNLEKAWDTKVIDRTALILEIFGERAHTREGVLQVELAHLTYQRSRLVSSWTHLERQRGGLGFVGGPGETQIEIDRRLIDERILKIKEKLETVKKTRFMQRTARKRVPFPVVALVGYTNAGKSTLFNKLTRADVFAKDLLFATLDPTMRRIRLPSGRVVILSDTVGFISELPTELVAAFRATLEEVMEADVIVHVRDYHHPDTRAQKKDVENVLCDLGLKDAVDIELVEALNKIDLFDKDDQEMIRNQKQRKPKEWPISAVTGEGVQELLECVEATLNRDRKQFKLMIPIEDGKTLARIYQKGQIIKRTDNEKTITLIVKLKKEDESLFAPYIQKKRKKNG